MKGERRKWCPLMCIDLTDLFVQTEIDLRFNPRTQNYPIALLRSLRSAADERQGAETSMLAATSRDGPAMVPQIPVWPALRLRPRDRLQRNAHFPDHLHGGIWRAICEGFRSGKSSNRARAVSRPDSQQSTAKSRKESQPSTAKVIFEF